MSVLVRAATVLDSDALQELGGVDVEPFLAEGIALVAERDGEVVGAALGGPGGVLRVLVAQADAADELGRALVAALAERHLEQVWTQVEAGDTKTRALAERFGFRDERVIMGTTAQELEARLARPAGASYGAIYVQTDDNEPLKRALSRFVPRLPDAQLTGPHNGWLEVTDAQLDADPKLLRRLGRELGVLADAVVFVLGVEEGAVVRYALLERGSLVDEYLSVPEFHGPLPPGEVVALGANPTAVARLTGADAAQIRALCRTASTPAELPPADELYRAIADAVGVV